MKATETTGLLPSTGAATQGEVLVPPDELAQLLRDTNFTQREIEDLYDHSKGENMTRSEFASLCAANGLTAKGLMQRMWAVFDVDSSGDVSRFELVKGLGPLLRGSREQVAGMFFDLYEVDGDGELSAEEISSVYSDMILLTDEDKKTGLTSVQKRRIADWVTEQQGLNKESGGRLNREAFVSAVLKMEVAAGDGKPSLLSCRSLYFIFLTAWFEVGTSFSLPAMGALAQRIKLRFGIEDAEIGQLTAAYFFAAMIGPLVGGYYMDKQGPGKVIIYANIVVTLGAFLQAFSHNYVLLMIGRLVIGFGGEVTPFCTIELLGRIFPDYFGLMAGIRNLIQAMSGFLAFVLLPLWAERASKYPLDDRGTSFALWMCVVLSAVSTLASIIVRVSMEKEKTGLSAEKLSDQNTITKTMRAFSKATTPELPDGIEKWKLPASFFFAAIGIKAQYFAPFAFTAFSIEIYVDKFQQSRARASFLTGFISLVSGFLGPIFGPLSDAVGKRCVCLTFFTGLSVIGFVLLAVGNSGPVIWIASVLFAIQYGFGDTVAYCCIRLITGVPRAGIGYGLYGIIGNLLSTIVPIGGGLLMELDHGNELVCWYFAMLMLTGSLCWLVVLALEGRRSLLELPAKDVIETSDEDLHLAALSNVVGPPGRRVDSLLRRSRQSTA